MELHGESWAPPLPDARSHHDDGRPPTGAARAGSVHVVVRGESLWAIASDALAPGATDAEVAAAWPVIYAANRAVIGDDPNLILPGQSLVIPDEATR